MNTNSLQRKTARLVLQVKEQYAPPCNHAVILYNPALHDEEWKKAEIARRIEQGAGYIKTIFLLPWKDEDPRYVH